MPEISRPSAISAFASLALATILERDHVASLASIGTVAQPFTDGRVVFHGRRATVEDHVVLFLTRLRRRHLDPGPGRVRVRLTRALRL